MFVHGTGYNIYNMVITIVKHASDLEKPNPRFILADPLPPTSGQCYGSYSKKEKKSYLLLVTSVNCKRDYFTSYCICT